MQRYGLSTTQSRRCAWAPALLAGLLLSGCAAFNRDNTPTFNLVEEHLWPESTAKRIAVAPAVYPLSLAAVGLDAAIVHPASVVDDTARETQETLWDDWDWDDHYVSECVGLPLRAAATPIYFVGDFVGRAFFSSDRAARDERTRQEDMRILDDSRQILDKAQKALEADNPQKALDSLEEADSRTLSRMRKAGEEDLALRMEFLRFKAACRSRRYEALNSTSRIRSLLNSPFGKDVEALLREMRRSDDPYARSRAFSLERYVRSTDKEINASVAAALRDPDGIVRHEALVWVKGRSSRESVRPLKPQVERAAREDGSPINRSVAKEILRLFRQPPQSGG
jgi:hypothetical protein